MKSISSPTFPVDYLTEHLRRTTLRPLEGLPTFVEDVYVFGYLRRKDCVYTRGTILCAQGELGSAKDIVATILLGVRKALDIVYANVSIIHTVAEKKHTLEPYPQSAFYVNLYRAVIGPSG